MKNSLFKLFGLLFIFGVAIISGYATKGNLLFSLLSIPVAAYAFQTYTGISFDSQSGLCTLAAIPKVACGTPNPGGLQKLYLISSDKVIGSYPKTADVTDGEITVAPTLEVGASFIEVGITSKTTKFDANLKGTSRHQIWEHMFECKVAGYTKEQCAAIEKLLNGDVMAVGIYNDGIRSLIGSSYLGLEIEVSHTSGAAGADRREWTIKGKNDGYIMGATPVASTVTLPGLAA